MERQRSRTTNIIVSAISALSLSAASLLFSTSTAVAAADNYAGAVVAGSGTVLGSTSYPTPAGAIFASPQGADTNPGTLDRPVRSVAKALALAPAGGTVVLRAGSYHESVTVSKQVTIQNYPREVVWFDGSSEVPTWTKSGSVWTAPWSTFFAPSSISGGNRSDYPNANLPAQVFIDGKALTEVASAAQVGSGTFFADSANRRLVIGSDPAGTVVRASDLDRAIVVAVQNVVFRGFGVQRYATNSTSRAAVLMDPDGGTFENLVVSDNSTIGLALSGANKTIRNITAERNGMMGLGMDRANNAVIENSVLRYNNSERFPTIPVASGMKITKASGLRIANNVVSDNYLAAGIWLDEYCRDAVIVGNTIVNNGEMGINFEASSRGIVADNVVQGSRKGIELRDTDRVKVMNNHVSGYSLMGIYLAQDERWSTLTGRPADIPLLVRDNTLANNIVGCGSRFQIFGKDDSTNIPMDKFNVTITGNVFSPRMKSPELNLVAWGLNDNDSVEFIQTTAQLATKNASWKNLQATQCVTNPETSFSAAELQSIAVPIPDDVANAIGAAAGAKVIGAIESAGTSVSPAPGSSTAPVASPTPSPSTSSPVPSATPSTNPVTPTTPSSAPAPSASTGGDPEPTNPAPAAPTSVPSPSSPVLERPSTDKDSIRAKILDSFTRQLRRAWGSADTGGKWNLATTNTANAKFYTTGSRGVIAMQRAGSASATMSTAVGTSTTSNALVTLDRRPAKGTAQVTLVGRQVGESNYGATLQVAANGTATVFAAKDGVQIGDAYRLSGKYRPGQKLRLRVDLSGTAPTTINIRVWANGKREPAGWQVRTTDASAALQAPGMVGIGATLSTSVRSTVKAKISTYRAVVRS